MKQKLIMFSACFLLMFGLASHAAKDVEFINSKTKSSEVMTIQTNQKVNSMRRKLARQLKVPPKNVKLYVKGKELTKNIKISGLEGGIPDRVFYAVNGPKKEQEKEDGSESDRGVINAARLFEEQEDARGEPAISVGSGDLKFEISGEVDKGKDQKFIVHYGHNTTVRQVQHLIAEQLGLKTHEVSIISDGKVAKVTRPFRTIDAKDAYFYVGDMEKEGQEVQEGKDSDDEVINVSSLFEQDADSENEEEPEEVEPGIDVFTLKGRDAARKETPEVKVHYNDTTTVREVQAMVAEQIGVKTHEVSIYYGSSQAPGSRKFSTLKFSRGVTYRVMKKWVLDTPSDPNLQHMKIKGKEAGRRGTFLVMAPAAYSDETTVLDVREQIAKEMEVNIGQIELMAKRRRLEESMKFSKVASDPSLHYVHYPNSEASSLDGNQKSVEITGPRGNVKISYDNKTTVSMVTAQVSKSIKTPTNRIRLRLLGRDLKAQSKFASHKPENMTVEYVVIRKRQRRR